MFRPHDLVQIHTDTGFDEEGLPTGLHLNGKGFVSIDQDEGSDFIQVWCHTHIGFDKVGINKKYLTIVEVCDVENRRN